LSSFFSQHRAHRDLPSSPTRRSSDLARRQQEHKTEQHHARSSPMSHHAHSIGAGSHPPFPVCSFQFPVSSFLLAPALLAELEFGAATASRQLPAASHTSRVTGPWPLTLAPASTSRFQFPVSRFQFPLPPLPCYQKAWTLPIPLTSKCTVRH